MLPTREHGNTRIYMRKQKMKICFNSRALFYCKLLLRYFSAYFEFSDFRSVEARCLKNCFDIDSVNLVVIRVSVCFQGLCISFRYGLCFMVKILIS